MAPLRDTSMNTVLLIADHLDRILACGEDLARLRYRPHKAGPDMATDTVTSFVRECHSHEMTAVAAILRAREHARSLAQTRTDLATLARLFASTTSSILDIVELTVPPEERAFDSIDPIRFLQSRGVLPEEMCCLKTVEEIVVDDDYMLAGCIHLGALMDMSAALLDAIEVHVDLFPADTAEHIETVDPTAPAETAGPLPDLR